MSARSNKIRTKVRMAVLLRQRLHDAWQRRSADERAWQAIVPVGREWGSPDFDRLMHDDLDKQTGVFDAAFIRRSQSVQVNP